MCHLNITALFACGDQTAFWGQKVAGKWAGQEGGVGDRLMAPASFKLLTHSAMWESMRGAQEEEWSGGGRWGPGPEAAMLGVVGTA